MAALASPLASAGPRTGSSGLIVSLITNMAKPHRQQPYAAAGALESAVKQLDRLERQPESIAVSVVTQWC